MICTCVDNSKRCQSIDAESFAKEAVFRFEESMDNSSLRDCIREYKPKYVSEFTHKEKEDCYLIPLYVCVPLWDYDLTHGMDCISHNVILPMTNVLTEKLRCELIKCYQSVNKGKEKHVKAEKILLTFYPIELPHIAWAARVVSTQNNVSLAVWNDYDINDSVAVFKISTYIKAKFTK